MIDLIDRQAAIDAVNNAFDRETLLTGFVRSIAVRAIRDVPTIQPDDRLAKIADILEGTIDHFDLEDAMDVLYQIKDVLR
jgi:hypothetical protein